MKLTKAQEKSLYAWCMEVGLSIEYGKLSLCDLRNFKYSEVHKERKYQVHSDDARYPWSGLYDDISNAIEKFMELKQKVKKIK
jgi:hypothetical protein